MKAFAAQDVRAPDWSWPHVRSSFVGIGTTPANYPSDDLSRTAFEAGASWIYVLEGQFQVHIKDTVHHVRAGSSVLFANPVMATLVYPEPMTRLVVGIYGGPSMRLMEWLIQHYGSFHDIPADAPVVASARALQLAVEAQPERSAHEWSMLLYDWFLTLWQHLEGMQLPPPAERVAVLSNSRLLGISYPNFRKFADAMGYDPAYLSRSLQKSWDHKSPARLLRLGRLQKAEELLRTSNLSVREIALAVRYSGPDAFAAAFRRTYGSAPLRYRHDYRLGKPPPSTARHD